nr:hypothetical protein asmbl_3 [uncultured bacterium]
MTAEPSGVEPEVIISPGKSTTLTFDAALLRTAGGVDTVELEKREAFALVDAGAATLRVIPSARLKPGERLRLKVQFQERAAPSGAVLTLVVHSARAEQVVEVYRNTRPVESYQQEAREARAQAAQCRADLERAQAECAGPGGLRGLLAAQQLGEEGVKAKDLTRTVTKVPENALSVRQVRSYRATGRVALELWLNAPDGAQPFTVDGAALTGKRGAELRVLPVWASGPITDKPDEPGLVAVEADATAAKAQGGYTLKLWEARTGRTVVVGNVTFP